METSAPYTTRQALLDAMRYLRRRGAVGMAGAVVASVIGVVAFIVIPNQYQGSMALRSYLLKSTATAQALRALHIAVKSEDSVAVARALGISLHSAAQLRKLGVAQPKYIEPEEANEILDVYVMADVSDPSLFDTLSVALPRYLNSVPLVDSLRRVRLATLTTNIDALKRELRTLDSLRALAARALNSNRDAKALGDLSSGNAVVGLHQNIRSLEQEVQLVRNSHVSAHFLRPTYPFYPSWKWFLALPPLLGFLLAMPLVDLWLLWRRSAQPD